MRLGRSIFPVSDIATIVLIALVFLTQKCLFPGGISIFYRVFLTGRVQL